MKQFKIIKTLILSISILTTSCGQNGINFYNEGTVLMGEEKYQEAIEVFSNGIKANDAAKSVNYYGRAYANYELRKLAEAKEDVAESLMTENINSEKINSDIYWLKAWIAAAEDDKQLEIESYQKALSYTPTNNWLKTSLGFALIENGQNREAINVLNEVIGDDANDAYALNNRGLAYLNLGAYEKAKLDLDRSMQLDEDNPFLYQNYFLYYQATGETDNACKALQQALEKDMSDYGEEKDSEKLKQLLVKSCK